MVTQGLQKEVLSWCIQLNPTAMGINFIYLVSLIAHKISTAMNISVVLSRK